MVERLNALTLDWRATDRPRMGGDGEFSLARIASQSSIRRTASGWRPER